MLNIAHFWFKIGLSWWFVDLLTSFSFQWGKCPKEFDINLWWFQYVSIHEAMRGFWLLHLPRRQGGHVKILIPNSMAILGLCKAYVREYPHKIWPCIVQYLHFRILKFPLKNGRLQLGTSAIKGGLSIVMFDYQRVLPSFLVGDHTRWHPLVISWSKPHYL